MRKFIAVLFLFFYAMSVGAAEITMTATDAVQMAGNMVRAGDFEHAGQILRQMPDTGSAPLEIERRFLLAQMAQKQGDFDAAIKIYQALLDVYPGLARVRFELAICYMHQKKWRRADYHLRLAMAGDDLSDDAKHIMNYYRYVVRRNKNWNVWFNFGAAPESNINNSVGGQECIMTMFGMMCRTLDAPEAAVGVNLMLGGNYEFKLSDVWRWKSEANIYSNFYDKNQYDDLYLTLSTGPRYVWTRGDVWLGVVGARRWYGWERYNRSVGARVDANYDFTRRLSGGLYLRIMDNKYDEYNDLLNGHTYSANIRLTYSFNSSMYAVLRGGISREVAAADMYSYWSPGIAVGLGAELPWGFHVYAGPDVYWNWYDAARWAVRDNHMTQIKERDFTHRYAMSVSNNKLDVFGFVPTITVSYTRRDSNIWQREFDKTAIEFTMQQRF
ncbi:MAG: surface lipoprotein assembly modifier [Alphaproteobacteria bacterium]|nr:surface lipoprotein assembly modifier [Alphaproteobacteria bacterium]